MPANRPNILWISLEDTSPRFGCYGDPLARTPNLDRLAAEGARFPNAFCTSGVSAPSRSAIITGLYQTALGTHHMRTTHKNRATPDLPTPYDAVIPHYVRCFPEYLRTHGYYCSNNDKTDYQFAPPFTAWDDCSRTGHWRNRAPGQPFFSVFNPTGTHESGMWPKDKALVTDPEKVELPPYLPNTRKAREALARHYDNLADSDRRVGELLAELEADGLAQNTIVFIWSDHGEGLPRRKRWPYDSGTRIPLLVRWPGGPIKPGSVHDRLVSLVDLGPTVLSLCGVPRPAHLHGQPFLGPDEVPREYVFSTRDRHDEAYDMVRSARDARYRYVRHYYPGTPYLPWIPYRNRHPVTQELWRLHRENQLAGDQNFLFRERPPEELFDTQNDPHELRNLAGDPAHRNVLERMRGALDDWRRTYGDLGDIPEEQMVRQWYPNRTQPQTAAPIAVPITEENCAQEPVAQTAAYAAPLLVQLHTPTQGASIGYQIDGDKTWRVYTAPLRLEKTANLRAKAIRIGFKESDTATWNLRIE
ncbi:MAG: sulfatase-like hydrolase/transferase [Planctomycetes bacterium]|nr:sulfatase-like hydrolase/transferase [Planctomycetota bacterium]